MRRVAVQAFRLARRPGSFKKPHHIRSRNSFFTPSSHAIGTRSLSSRRERVVLTALQSSMFPRGVPVAALSALVAAGAFYSYRSIGPQNITDASPSASASGDFSGGPSGGLSGSSEEEVQESIRRALVVGHDSLYTGTISGEGPLSKETDDYGRKVLEMMTPDQATQKLRKKEESWIVGRGQGVVRYDVVQIPSNDPIEDDHAEKIIEFPQSAAGAQEEASNSDWMFWGVFDGHSGWITSAKLRRELISFVARELNTTYSAALKDPALKFPTPDSIDAAIKQGFLLLDHEIVHESVNKVNKAQSKRVAAELLAPALSGSCALLSFYDARSKLLRVACTGDSRAILGRRAPSGKWTATPLSVDQTGGSPEEEARLRREHPDEPHVVRNGRILGGLEPSRAFGDAVYKWTQATQQKLKQSYFGRSAPPLIQTPPYVTAEPVVTTTKIEPEKGDFVVMATDGLWEMLTNEEVVGLVGQWLEKQSSERGGGPTSSPSSWLSGWFSSGGGLPVEKQASSSSSSAASAAAGGDSTDGSGQRAPIRQQQWGVDTAAAGRFVVQDKNAATHLVRNALGGRDSDQLCALLTLPSPYSRRYRDDLTVEVIFFGDAPATGRVELNREATAAAAGDAKAKL